MKIFFITVFILTMSMIGCDSIVKEVNDPYGFDYSIVTIDGCEYIKVDDGFAQCRVFSITHKGNCKNPIHKR